MLETYNTNLWYKCKSKLSSLRTHVENVENLPANSSPSNKEIMTNVRQNSLPSLSFTLFHD